MATAREVAHLRDVFNAAAEGAKEISVKLAQVGAEEENFHLESLQRFQLALASDTVITHLAFDGPVASQSGQALALSVSTALEANCSLLSLTIACIPCGDTAVGSLCKALTANTSLRSLALNFCGITSRGCRMLAEALCNGCRLTKLELAGDTDVGDDGADALAEALRANATLTHLGLMFCGISTLGVQALCDSLRQNSSLNSLDLMGNHSIGPAGARSLVELLKVNCTLFQVRLKDSGISSTDPSLALVNELAARNREVPIVLSLRYDSIDTAHLRRLSGEVVRDSQDLDLVLQLASELTPQQLQGEIEARAGVKFGRLHVVLPDGSLLHKLTGPLPLPHIAGEKKHQVRCF